MFYQLKRMTNEEEFQSFVNAYSLSFKDRSRVAKRELTVTEMRHSDYVWGLFKGKKIIAGFVLNYNPNRCLQEFSIQERALILSDFNLNEICELVAIFKLPSEKRLFATLALWINVIFKTLSLRRKYIFGCNRSIKIGSDYYYKSDLQFIPNPNSDLQIFYYTRKQFLMTFVNSLKSFVNKKILKKNKVSFNMRKKI